MTVSRSDMGVAASPAIEPAVAVAAPLILVPPVAPAIAVAAAVDVLSVAGPIAPASWSVIAPSSSAVAVGQISTVELKICKS